MQNIATGDEIQKVTKNRMGYLYGIDHNKKESIFYGREKKLNYKNYQRE